MSPLNFNFFFHNDHSVAIRVLLSLVSKVFSDVK